MTLLASKIIKAAKKEWCCDVWATKSGEIKSTIYKRASDILFFRTWECVKQEELQFVPAKVLKVAADLLKKHQEQAA